MHWRWHFCSFLALYNVYNATPVGGKLLFQCQLSEILYVYIHQRFFKYAILPYFFSVFLGYITSSYQLLYFQTHTRCSLVYTITRILIYSFTNIFLNQTCYGDPMCIKGILFCHNYNIWGKHCSVCPGPLLKVDMWILPI